MRSGVACFREHKWRWWGCPFFGGFSDSSRPHRATGTRPAASGTAPRVVGPAARRLLRDRRASSTTRTCSPRLFLPRLTSLTANGARPRPWLPEPDNTYDARRDRRPVRGRDGRLHPCAICGDVGRPHRAGLKTKGSAPRITAELWIGQHAWFVNLLAREDGEYRTPARARRGEAADTGARRPRPRRWPRRRPPCAATCGGPDRANGQAWAAAGPVHHVSRACDRSGGAVLPARSRLPRPRHRSTSPWVGIPRPAAWAVIDLETTGCFTRVDRIVEIAVVRLAPDG